MGITKEIFSPYFNAIEKKIIYSALEEAADHIRNFYCFSPREWFNYCYHLSTAEERPPLSPINKKAFAEVQKYLPNLEKKSAYPLERYQIFLFDPNILQALRTQSDLEFYPFMLYILTHELLHVARFCQNLHPFECDNESLQKEETKINLLTQQVLKIKKSNTLNRLISLYNWTNPCPRPSLFYPAE